MHELYSKILERLTLLSNEICASQYLELLAKEIRQCTFITPAAHILIGPFRDLLTDEQQQALPFLKDLFLEHHDV